MQIILKQREIEAALRGYVMSEGINLTGKSVKIDFTAGRKEAGIIAEIDIEDAGPSTFAELGAAVFNSPNVSSYVSPEAAAQVAQEPAQAEPEPAPVVAEPEPEAKAPSLFG